MNEGEDPENPPGWVRTLSLETHPGPCAALAPDGRVLAVNAAWQEAAVANEPRERFPGLGGNVVAACEGDADAPASARRIAGALREVLAGRTERSAAGYRAHNGATWRRAEVRPVHTDGCLAGAVVTHVDVSEAGVLAQYTEAGVAVLDADGRVAWINAALHRAWGHAVDAVRGMDPFTVAIGPGTDGRLLDRLRHAARTGQAAHAQIVRRHRDGPPYLVAADIEPVRRAGAASKECVLVERAVTRHSLEAALDSARAAALAGLARGDDQDTVLDSLTQRLEAAAVEIRVSILVVEDDPPRLRHAAAPSLPRAYVDAVDGLAIARGAGSCGAAAWSGERVVAADIRAHPNWQPYRREAELSGMRACWAEPVAGVSGEVLATFAIYTPTPREPSAEEIGFIEQAAATVRAVVERKTLEAAVSAREREARDIFTNAPIGLSRTSADDRFLAANPALVKILGYADEHDLVARARVSDFYADPDERARVLREVEAAGSISDQVVRVRRRDGSEIWGMLDSRIVQRGDAAGGAVYEGALRDVTARVEAEKALARSEARFRRMFTEAGVGIALVDLDGWLLEANPALGTILGRAPADLAGIHFAEVTDPRDTGADLEAFAELRRGERASYRMEKRYLRPDGGLVWGHLTVSLVRGEDGAPEFAVGMLEDVTQRRELEQELRAARDAAQRADAAKTTFLANVSHELRTPLNAVLGYTEMIEREVLGPVGHRRYAEYAGDIRRSGEHLRDVLGDVLDLARIEKGAYRVEPAEVAPADVVADALAVLGHPQAEVDVPADLRVVTDRLALRQVVVNLLGNAVKHANVGLRVEAGYTADGGIALSVADAGPGIPESELPHVTEPFSRAGSASTSSSGSGLGLAVCTRIAEALGGRLSIASTPGQGTTTTLRLPPHGPLNAAETPKPG